LKYWFEQEVCGCQYLRTGEILLLSLQKLHQKYGVLSEDIYNMNEKECVLSFNEHVQMMIHWGHHLTDWQQTVSDNRDYVTVVEEVSTTGFLISSLVIFKNKKMSVKWVKDQALKVS
jgi:hypothetical protein